MRECGELGIKHVWMHRSYGAGSVNEAGTTYGREHGITVLNGGCPVMFDPTADFGHKVMRVVYRSHVPRTVRRLGHRPPTEGEAPCRTWK